MNTTDAGQTTVRALESGIDEVVIPAPGAGKGVDAAVRLAVRRAVARGAVVRSLGVGMVDEDGFSVDGSAGVVVVR